jgi:hypothetical protein
MFKGEAEKQIQHSLKGFGGSNIGSQNLNI